MLHCLHLTSREAKRERRALGGTHVAEHRSHFVSSCRVEEYLPNLAAEIEKASLVVSHAGAGSIFESLLFQVPLVVVPNPILMGNHQVELANLMDQLQHAVCVLPQVSLVLLFTTTPTVPPMHQHATPFPLK